jgi:hypothetical protein
VDEGGGSQRRRVGARVSGLTPVAIQGVSSVDLLSSEREQSYQRRAGGINSPSTGRSVIHRYGIRASGAGAAAPPWSRALCPCRSGPAEPVRRLLGRSRPGLRPLSTGDRPTPTTPAGPSSHRPASSRRRRGLRGTRARLPAGLQGAGPPRPRPTPGRRAGGRDRRAGGRGAVARPDPVRGRRGSAPRRAARRAAGPARGSGPAPARRRRPRRARPGAGRRPTGHRGAHRRRAWPGGHRQVRRPASGEQAGRLDPGDHRR